MPRTQSGTHARRRRIAIRAHLLRPLAGRLAVAIADRLQDDGHVVLTADGGEVTATGRAFFAAHGSASTCRRGRIASSVAPCIDWTERRPHLAGYVGAVICSCAKSRGRLGAAPCATDARRSHVTKAARGFPRPSASSDGGPENISAGGPASAARLRTAGLGGRNSCAARMLSGRQRGAWNGASTTRRRI